MGITSKQTGKFRGMMRKIENEQLKIKADSVKRKKKDGNKSRGTKHMIDLAKRYNLNIHIIKYNQKGE